MAQGAPAVDPLKLERGRVSHDRPELASEYRLLRERLKRSHEVLAALRFPAHFVTNHRGAVGQDNSGSALGVHLVDTVHGPKVIKLIGVEAHTRNPEVGDPANRASDQALIQLQLGELGFAVPVSGTLSHEDVAALLERFPGLRPTAADRPPPKFGVVMDYVPDGWNPKPLQNRADRQRPAPAWASYLDFEQLEQRVARACLAIEALGLQDHDFQLMFNRKGEAFVIDPELFEVRDREDAASDEALRGTLARLSERPLPESFGQGARRARSYLETLHGLVFSGTFDEGASYRSALRSLELKSAEAAPGEAGAAGISPTALTQSPGGPFRQGERLGLTRQELQWHALNVLRDSPELPAELRDIAQGKLGYFQRPRESRPFAAAVRGAIDHARLLRDAIEYALETFTSDAYDGRFRELLEARRRALPP